MLCASRQNWETASREICCRLPMRCFHGSSLLAASMRPAAGPQGYMQAQALSYWRPLENLCARLGSFWFFVCLVFFLDSSGFSFPSVPTQVSVLSSLCQAPELEVGRDRFQGFMLLLRNTEEQCKAVLSRANTALPGGSS